MSFALVMPGAHSADDRENLKKMKDKKSSVSGSESVIICMHGSGSKSFQQQAKNNKENIDFFSSVTIKYCNLLSLKIYGKYCNKLKSFCYFLLTS